MKKPAIIIGSIILIGLIYFICSEPETNKKEGPIVGMETTSGEVAEDHYNDTSGDDPFTGYEDPDAPQKDAVPVAKNTLSYKYDREMKPFVYEAIAGFTKVAATEEMTGYVVNFSIDRDKLDPSDATKISHVLSLLLPTVVTPGTFTEQTSGLIVQYFGPEPGIYYELDQDSPFSITVQEWGGPGGRARGYFSGTLKSNQTSGKVMLHDGRFDASIK